MTDPQWQEELRGLADYMNGESSRWSFPDIVRSRKYERAAALLTDLANGQWVRREHLEYAISKYPEIAHGISDFVNKFPPDVSGYVTITTKRLQAQLREREVTNETMRVNYERDLQQCKEENAKLREALAECVEIVKEGATSDSYVEQSFRKKCQKALAHAQALHRTKAQKL